MTYEEQVRATFPCPAGYREIELDEELPPDVRIHDRIEMDRQTTFIRWDDCGYVRVHCHKLNLPVQTPHCWFVVPIVNQMGQPMPAA